MDLYSVCRAFDAKSYQGVVYSFETHDGVPLGRMIGYVVSKLRELQRDKAGSQLLTSTLEIQETNHVVKFRKLPSSESRTEAIGRLVKFLRAKKLFAVLDGWRDEFYSVYTVNRQVYFCIERAASGLFGVVTYGCHINGYIPARNPKDFKFWIAKRSASKQTWPNYLDNTVAGGIDFSRKPFDAALKECKEEAGLPASFVQCNLRSAGAISYEFQAKPEDSEDGLIQPEVQYVYDLNMGGRIPIPNDNEVDSFQLFTLDDVLRLISEGKFKYNCALVLVDFLIRHGILCAEELQSYLHIIEQCHRVLPYPLR